MPKKGAMLLQAERSWYFAETNVVHGHIQTPLDPDDAHTHTFRGADVHSLYKPTRTLQGFKNSDLHMQVHIAEFIAQIKANKLYESTIGCYTEIFP